jgi:hypothetical protein
MHPATLFREISRWLFSSFMSVGRFWGCHKMAYVLRSVLGLACFSLSDGMWQRLICPQAAWNALIVCVGHVGAAAKNHKNQKKERFFGRVVGCCGGGCCLLETLCLCEECLSDGLFLAKLKCL